MTDRWLKLEDLQVTAFETTTDSPSARGIVHGEVTGAALRVGALLRS